MAQQASAHHEARLIKARRRKDILRPLLQMRGLSPRRWAARAGVNPDLVLEFCNGRAELSDEDAAALADVLGIGSRDLPD